jgi:hypothetical protein
MVRADPHCRLQNDPPPRAALALKHGAHRSGGGSEGKDRVLIAGAGIDEGLEVEEGVQPYDLDLGCGYYPTGVRFRPNRTHPR